MEVTSEAIGNVCDIIEDIEKSEGAKGPKAKVALAAAARNSSSLVVDVHLTPEQQGRKKCCLIDYMPLSLYLQ